MPDLSLFHFLRPWWLAAFAPAVALIWIARRQQRADQVWTRIVDPHLLPHLLVGAEGRRRLFAPAPLLMVVWSLTIVALAGPAWQREPTPFADDSGALVIAIEVTPTMEARDVQPSRLARAVHKLRDLMRERPGAATALVAFRGSAHLAVPLTRDASLVEWFAAELAPDVMPVDGEATGEAVALAEQVLARSGERGSILLVTDGVPPDQHQALAEHRSGGGVPVHMLAVGAGPEAPAPLAGPPAPPLDRESLRAAAKAGGGTLTVVAADDADVERIARHAEHLVGSPRGSGESERWRDSGYWLVAPLALLCSAWFRRGWLVRWG